MALTPGLVAVWLVLPAAQAWALLLFGLVFGVAIGGFSALTPALMADYFGAGSVGGVIGIAYTGTGLGALIGPWLTGVMYDRTGSYQPALILGAVAAAVATLAVLRLRDPTKTPARLVSTGRPGR